jgi:hypothetical protein
MATCASVQPAMLLKRICRAAFTHPCQRAAGSREIRFEFDLFGNPKQLLLALEHGKKLTKILISTHRDTLDLSGRCVECRDLARPHVSGFRIVQRGGHSFMTTA